MTIKVGDRYRENEGAQERWIVRSANSDRCELQSIRRWNLRIFETPARLSNQSIYTREITPMTINPHSPPETVDNRLELKPNLSEWTRGEVLDQIRTDAFGDVATCIEGDRIVVGLSEFSDYELFAQRFDWAIENKVSQLDEECA